MNTPKSQLCNLKKEMELTFVTRCYDCQEPDTAIHTELVHTSTATITQSHTTPTTSALDTIVTSMELYTS